MTGSRHATTSMAHVRLFATGLVAVVLAAQPGTQRLPDFAGDWRLQPARSGPPVDVWGQSRAVRLVVVQSASELSFEPEGGGLSVPIKFQRFRLDGAVLEFLDDSLGDLGSFVRKVRTEARWDGTALSVLSERFGETVEEGVRIRTAGSITSVWRMRLVGTDLQIERSGLRSDPPRILHGRPYSRADDLVYNRDIAVYAQSRLSAR
jgi:hypothetical protein